MSTLSTLTIFLGDAVITGAAGWLIARRLLAREAGMLERGLGWLLSMLLLVAGSAVALGQCGGLGPAGFLMFHSALLGALVTQGRTRTAGDFSALARLAGDVRGLFGRTGPERLVLMVLVIVVVFLLTLAALGQPQVYDALTYRLPRIGEWLQDGRIGHLATDDDRINFMAIGPDLVVAWLIGAWPDGYQFAALAQALGGVLLLGATMGLARQFGLSRLAALGSVVLVLGMGNVSPQMTSLHTDLFAAGVFAAAFYLWVQALSRGGGSILGGAGVAFAVASKGSVLYLLPGALCWAGWAAWRHRAGVGAWIRTTGGATLAGLVFLLPPMLRNEATFGSATAPAASVLQHYGLGLTFSKRADKLGLNLRSSLAQLCEPVSQPWWAREPAAALSERLIAALPAHDPYAFQDLDRRDTLRSYLTLTRPDADMTSPGILITSLFVFGGIFAAFRCREPVAAGVAASSLGVVLYFITQNALIQWHPWGFRYAVLAAPWMAVVAAWAIQQAPSRLRLLLWAAAMVSAGMVWVDTTFFTTQSGWCAVNPPTARSWLMNGWRDWAMTLRADTSDIRLAQPVNRLLARFYRLPGSGRVHLVKLSEVERRTTAEAATRMGAGWLVLPLDTFAGREGLVFARTWLHEGGKDGEFSLAAYRELRPGETSPPVFYRNSITHTPTGVRCHLRLRGWQKSVRLELANPSSETWSYVVPGASPAIEGRLTGRSTAIVEVTVDDTRLTDLTVEFFSNAPIGQATVCPAVVAAYPSAQPIGL